MTVCMYVQYKGVIYRTLLYCVHLVHTCIDLHAKYKDTTTQAVGGGPILISNSLTISDLFALLTVLLNQYQ